MWCGSDCPSMNWNSMWRDEAATLLQLWAAYLTSKSPDFTFTVQKILASPNKRMKLSIVSMEMGFPHSICFRYSSRKSAKCAILSWDEENWQSKFALIWPTYLHLKHFLCYLSLVLAGTRDRVVRCWGHWIHAQGLMLYAVVETLCSTKWCILVWFLLEEPFQQLCMLSVTIKWYFHDIFSDVAMHLRDGYYFFVKNRRLERYISCQQQKIVFKARSVQHVVSSVYMRGGLMQFRSAFVACMWCLKQVEWYSIDEWTRRGPHFEKMFAQRAPLHQEISEVRW